MLANLHSLQVLVVAVWLVGTPLIADEQNQLIVFDSQWIPEKVEYRNIFVVRADGTGLRQITQAPRIGYFRARSAALLSIGTAPDSRKRVNDSQRLSM